MTEGFDTADRHRKLMAISVGDVRKREQMRDRFREAQYGMVINLAEELKYPDLMNQSEHRMVRIALQKFNGR